MYEGIKKYKDIKKNKYFIAIKRILLIFLLVLFVGIFMIFVSLIKYSDLTSKINSNNINKSKSKIDNNILTPKEYWRGADQTFLTFPEWFLVFAPQSQADFLNTKTNSNYPYLADTAGIRQSYNIVYNQIKDKYEFNGGYHLMIFVIATSSSIEYNLKSIYESTIGFLTDTNKVLTNEDKMYGEFANNYVNFIYDTPWYEFDFLSELVNFNKNNTIFGKHFIRKSERKLIINIELFTKYIYSKIIKAGTKGVYDPAIPTTIVLLDKNPNNIFSENKKSFNRIKILDKIEVENDIYYLVSLPRYDKFKDYSIYLSQNDINFIEIAGNKSEILVSIIANKGSINNNILKNSNILFTQKMINNSKIERVVFTVDVGNLSKELKIIDEKGVKLEHIFDF